VDECKPLVLGFSQGAMLAAVVCGRGIKGGARRPGAGGRHTRRRGVAYRPRRRREAVIRGGNGGGGGRGLHSSTSQLNLSRF